MIYIYVQVKKTTFSQISCLRQDILSCGSRVTNYYITLDLWPLMSISEFIKYGGNRLMSGLVGLKGVEYSSPTLSSAISNLTPAFTFTLAIIFRLLLLLLLLFRFCFRRCISTTSWLNRNGCEVDYYYHRIM